MNPTHPNGTRGSLEGRSDGEPGTDLAISERPRPSTMIETREAPKNPTSRSAPTRDQGHKSVCPLCGRSHEGPRMRRVAILAPDQLSDDPRSSARSGGQLFPLEWTFPSTRPPESLAHSSAWSSDVADHVGARGRGSSGSPVPPVPTPAGGRPPTREEVR